MIIKGQKTKSYALGYFGLLTTILVALVFLRFYTPQQESEDRLVVDEVILCDAENLSGEYFTSGEHQFSGGETRSKEAKNSGSYSSKLEGDQLYSMTYKMEQPVPGAKYKVEIWSYNKHPVEAFFVVSGSDPSLFYRSADSPVERRGDFWERWELYFTVPKNTTPEFINIYAYKKKGPNSIFFDDLKISYISKDINVNEDLFEPQEFNLTIDIEGMDKLQKNRDKSIAQGLVFHDGTKVKAKIWDDERFKSAKIRHKGDWLDHMGKNPSYRVDMNSEESWQGMQSFSVQEPNTRGFLREWVFFKFLDHADVIRPRYDFMYFKQNKKDRIIFSYEEHFTKNLVENRNRREGPIVKMTEDRIWEVTKRTIQGWKRSLPKIEEKNKAYWSSELKAFKESKLAKNPKLRSNFEVAQNLLHQFKYNLKPTKEIFDLERMAKYLALVDICLAHHAVTWHNQRFYYNPVTSLLEPIGFDAYSAEDPQNYASKIYAEAIYTKGAGHKEPVDDLLFDDDFVRKYMHYLNEYSDPEFLQVFLESLEEPIVAREVFIRKRHANYKYNRDFIKKKATKIQIAIPPHVNSLQVFTHKKEADRKIIKLINQHNFPLELITGSELNERSSIIYPQIWGAVPIYTEWIVPEGVKSIQYKIPGLNEVHSAAIADWGIQENEAPRQDLAATDLSNFSDILTLSEGEITFNSGAIKIKEPLIIPEGGLLKIKAGTEVTLSGNGFILSYSPVQIVGDPDEPIIINCSDGKNGSFSVIQANGRSRLRNVIFKNQNTLNYKNWELSGAVNFYESDVDIMNASFTNNKCEDALNLIRSDFHMEETNFSNTFGDAFDSDFCEGKVVNSNFYDIGNDAIDASGSQLKIEGTKIVGAGDKGISAGEQSTIIVDWVRISGAVIGMASKDKSKLYTNNITLQDCLTGFTAFQKKPEYGPATIDIGKVTEKNVKRMYLAEEGSLIKIKKDAE